jgi:hypothetical protein
MKTGLRCGLLFSILTITGCGGGPRLDATSMDTLAASRKAMETDMTDNQKRQLATDLADALGPEAAQTAMKNAFSKEKKETSQSELYKPLQGLTATEIHDRAETNRQARKKR